MYRASIASRGKMSHDKLVLNSSDLTINNKKVLVLYGGIYGVILTYFEPVHSSGRHY